MSSGIKEGVKNNIAAFLTLAVTYGAAWGFWFREKNNLDVERDHLNAERIAMLEKQKSLEIDTEKVRLRLANVEDQQKKTAQQRDELEQKAKTFDTEAKLHEMITEFVTKYSHLERRVWSREELQTVTDDKKRAGALLDAIHSYVISIGKEKEYADFLRGQGKRLSTDALPAIGVSSP